METLSRQQTRFHRRSERIRAITVDRRAAVTADPVKNGGVSFGLATGLFALVIGFLACRRRFTHPSPSPDNRASRPSRDDGVDPFDAAEIEIRLNAIGSEQADAYGRRLAALIQRLVDRGVPARVVEIEPGFAAARIRFADGTTVLARGDTAGDLGILAAVMRECSATPASCVTDASGTHVTFAWPGRRRRLSVHVIGVDQPA